MVGYLKAATMPKSHRPYTAKFWQRIVDVVRKRRTPEDVARQFEPSARAIWNWVKQAALDPEQRVDGLTTEERRICGSSGARIGDSEMIERS